MVKAPGYNMVRLAREARLDVVQNPAAGATWPSRPP